jgi:REP element-mobilizing transposase RayT
MIVGQFKSVATKSINALRDTPGASVWQRNYYEHVIRNEDDLNQIRQCILDNPVQWDVDEENPERATSECPTRMTRV